MTEQKRLGTLVVIAMEARNLSTRDIVGKGDPFVAFHLDGDSKRTKADKRGGQHPKWDEEVRFIVMKNTSKRLKIQVFNDDKREPVLIGDSTIDLSEVLEKTEWDEWHEINFRNKYSGEVSLEMTFYYDEPPPQKIAHHQPAHSNSLPPQTPQTPVLNSYPSSSTHIAPTPVVNKPMSAPSAYPPPTVYPPVSSAVSSAPSNVYPPSNIYPPPNSPPQSQSSQSFGPNRTQSSQYPPASSPANVYPPQSQGYPPAYPPVSSPPVSSPPFRSTNVPPTRQDSGSVPFPLPIPTPVTNNSYPPSGAYPPNNFPPNNFPPNNFPPNNFPPNNFPPNNFPPNNFPPNNFPPNNNIYPPPVSGGTIYPPPNNVYNQGYPPNAYPPSGF